jgi:transposase InsO family protein
MAEEVTPMHAKMVLAALPDGCNLSAWCRQLGISRQTAYKWRARFRAEGQAGLEDRSRAARAPAGRTSAEVEDAVVALRKQLAGDGLDHGPASVRDRLAQAGTELSDATVWRILVRRGQVAPQPAKRPRSSWRRFARVRPNECWQGDDTHYFLAGGTEVRIINMLDDHSRLNVASLAVRSCTTERIWEAFCAAAGRYGTPAEFLNDNGPAWISREGYAPVVFQRGLVNLHVRQIHSAPYHPQTCGKTERFHQTQRRWLAARPAARDLEELQALLEEFRRIYNEERPHRAIGRRTPAEVWAAQPPAAPPQDALGGARSITTHVVHRGRITPGYRLSIGLGAQWSGAHVTMVRRGDHAVVIANATGEVIRELDINPNRTYQPTGQPRGPRPQH